MVIPRKPIAAVMGLSLVLSVTGIHSVSADTANLEDKVNQIQQEKEQLGDKLEQLQQKKEKNIEKINQLADDILATQKKIDAKQSEIEASQAKVDKLKKHIMETQKRINRREKILKDRVRVMYKTGGAINYIQVLLGSENFTDFLDRVFALNLIMEQDQNLLKAQKQDKKKLNADKEAIKETLGNLQSQLDAIEEMQAKLEGQKQEAAELVAELEEKSSEVKEKKELQSEKLAEAKAKLEHAREVARSKREAAQASGGQEANHGGASTFAVSGGGEPTGSVQEMIQAARSYIGNSVYVFGGGRNRADIQNGIFDCSSFIHWAYAQIGVDVGWSTYTLVNDGERISVSELKPGDMVFFNTYKRNGHVGIYIGNGKFIGCQSSSGVSIENMNASYWRNHFTGYARRVIGN